MCTFYDSLPKKSKSIGNQKARNLAISLKPCADDRTYYRFRLLAFSSDGKNDRDYPWIERFVHQKWGTHPEKGFPMVIDEVTCPVTKHVHVEGNRYNACKMCDVANKYFVAFKESGWKDKEANRKNKDLGRKFQGIIPVYVVDDPNFDGNNGRFKVLILNDKKLYEEFKSRVDKASLKYKVFNGTNAVDCCIHVAEVAEVKNQGQPNEYTWKHKVIDKIVFSKEPKDIPSITKEAVSNMGFDEEYYTSSTPEEILAFYNKYCRISNDDIPEDEGEIPVYEPPKAVSVERTNTVKVNTTENLHRVNNDIPEDDLNTLTVDADDEFALPMDEPSAPSSLDSSTDDIENILKGIEL